jgi:hypothetical protein
MPAKKMRVEVSNGHGSRYTITFEGEVTREKALRLVEIIELLGGVHDKQEQEDSAVNVSKFEKTKTIVEKHFPLKWFSSKEVLTAYEQEFNEPMSLSTVSTYLARMASRGFLLHQGSVCNRLYRKVTQLAQNNLRDYGR